MRVFPALRIGSGDKNRTCDTGLMSPLLYRLSYAARKRWSSHRFLTSLYYHSLSRGSTRDLAAFLRFDVPARIVVERVDQQGAEPGVDGDTQTAERGRDQGGERDQNQQTESS
jgi:hypothetical protein